MVPVIIITPVLLVVVIISIMMLLVAAIMPFAIPIDDGLRSKGRAAFFCCHSGADR